MNLYVRLSTQEVISRTGGMPPLASFKRAEDGHEVRVVFLDDHNVPTSITVPAGKTLAMTFGLKARGDFAAASFLAATSIFTEETSGGVKTYILKPSFNTVGLNALFANESESVRCMGEVSWRLDTISPPAFGGTIKTETFDVIVTNSVNRGIEGLPEVEMASLEALFASTNAAIGQRLIFRSALTGGESTELDGVVTLTLPVLTPCLVSTEGTLSMWQLQVWDGTTAEDTAAGLVLPDDANAITNAKIWVRLS
jgi:hypothetical protein